MVLFLFLDISFIQLYRIGTYTSLWKRDKVVLVIKKISQQIVPICCGLVITYRQDSYQKKKARQVIYGMEPLHILYCIWQWMRPRILKKQGKGIVRHWHGKEREWSMDKIRNWPLNCHSDSLRPAVLKARELYQIWSPLHPFISWQFDTVLVLVYSLQL